MRNRLMLILAVVLLAAVANAARAEARPALTINQARATIRAYSDADVDNAVEFLATPYPVAIRRCRRASRYVVNCRVWDGVPVVEEGSDVLGPPGVYTLRAYRRPAGDVILRDLLTGELVWR